jgi:hypothetical protein
VGDRGETIEVLDAQQADHVLDESCWCRPRIETCHPVTGAPYSEVLVIHRDPENDDVEIHGPDCIWEEPGDACNCEPEKAEPRTWS